MGAGGGTPGPFVGQLSYHPPLSSGGDPRGGRDYVATRPSCGPLLILFPAVKR